MRGTGWRGRGLGGAGVPGGTEAGGRWLTYTATRNGIPWSVSERIRRADGGGQWAEISEWYWPALFHPQDGPWIAETVIAPLAP